MKLQRIGVLVCAIWSLSACITVTEGKFGLVTKEPEKATEKKHRPIVQGSDCESYLLYPSFNASVGDALHTAMAKAGYPANLLTDVKVDWRIETPGIGWRLCMDVTGTPVAVGEDGTVQRVQVVRPPTDRGGWRVFGAETGHFGVLSEGPLPSGVETVGGPVAGDDCIWSLLFIPLNGLFPRMHDAVEDALPEDHPEVNALVNGSWEMDALVTLVLNRVCWDVQGTPAHTELPNTAAPAPAGAGDSPPM